MNVRRMGPATAHVHQIPPAQSALSFVDAASSKQCEMISKVCRMGGMRGGERGEAGEEAEEETFFS